MAWPIWRRLLAHLTRLAVSRARLSDGNRIEISSAIMPITTSNSTRENPLVRLRRFIIKLLSECVMARRLIEQSTDRIIEMIAVQPSTKAGKFDHTKLCRHD